MLEEAGVVVVPHLPSFGSAFGGVYKLLFPAVREGSATFPVPIPVALGAP